MVVRAVGLWLIYSALFCLSSSTFAKTTTVSVVSFSSCLVSQVISRGTASMLVVSGRFYLSELLCVRGTVENL